MGKWPRALHAREAGGARLTIPVPQPRTGVLVLEENLELRALPGRLLDHVDGPIHYLDLGGVQASSLADFGGSDELLAGITKLYASHCGLRSLDGLHRLPSIRWLYLDHNQLGEAELMRLAEVLPAGARLEALDVRDNTGCTPQVEEQLQGSSLLARAEFMNGQRLHRQ